MHKISIDNVPYILKSSWEEFSKQDFLKVAFIRAKNLKQDYSQIDFNAARITLFATLSNVPYKSILKINDMQWVDILPHLNYCFKDAPGLNTNLIPSVQIGFKKLYGPVGLLDKVSIGEMASADTAFTSASNDMDMEKIYLLNAILYRPKRKDLSEFRASKKWNGDVREPFNMTTCKARVSMFKKLDAHYVVATFLYYWSFREKKLMPFTRIFKKATGMSTKTNRGWAGTILEMANLPVFGDLEKTSEQEWFTVLYEMDRQLEIEEIRQQEADRRK
jgi:hypothetical protein